MLGFHSLDHHGSLPPVYTVRPDPQQWWCWLVLGFDEADPCRAYRCIAVIEPGMVDNETLHLTTCI